MQFLLDVYRSVLNGLHSCMFSGFERGWAFADYGFQGWMRRAGESGPILNVQCTAAVCSTYRDSVWFYEDTTAANGCRDDTMVETND